MSFELQQFRLQNPEFCKAMDEYEDILIFFYERGRYRDGKPSAYNPEDPRAKELESVDRDTVELETKRTMLEKMKKIFLAGEKDPF